MTRSFLTSLIEYHGCRGQKRGVCLELHQRQEAAARFQSIRRMLGAVARTNAVGQARNFLLQILAICSYQQREFRLTLCLRFGDWIALQASTAAERAGACTVNGCRAGLREVL